MDTIEFVSWPKTPRLFKDSMVITEKIDGTNSAVGVVEGWIEPEKHANGQVAWAEADGDPYTVYAQSRNRLICPATPLTGKGADNYAFAAWVWNNHHDLARILGPGLHYGEWWGAGIGRGYGRTDRSFSLFNTSRWKHLVDYDARCALNPPDELDVVPVLRVSTLDTGIVREELARLKEFGSVARGGYMDPEGVCVFIPSSQQVYKVTMDGDYSKWQSPREVAKDAEALAELANV